MTTTTILLLQLLYYYDYYCYYYYGQATTDPPHRPSGTDPALPPVRLAPKRETYETKGKRLNAGVGAEAKNQGQAITVPPHRPSGTGSCRPPALLAPIRETCETKGKSKVPRANLRRRRGRRGQPEVRAENNRKSNFCFRTTPPKLIIY